MEERLSGEETRGGWDIGLDCFTSTAARPSGDAVCGLSRNAAGTVRSQCSFVQAHGDGIVQLLTHVINGPCRRLRPTQPCTKYGRKGVVATPANHQPLNSGMTISRSRCLYCCHISFKATGARRNTPSPSLRPPDERDAACPSEGGMVGFVAAAGLVS